MDCGKREFQNWRGASTRNPKTGSPARRSRRLAFGHQFEGRLLNTGEPYSRTTDADGFAHITIGSEIIAAPNTIEGDTMCLNRDPTIGQRACSAIFRNPGGSAAQKNEYLLFNHGSRFEFSVVKGTGEESAAPQPE